MKNNIYFLVLHLIYKQTLSVFIRVFSSLVTIVAFENTATADLSAHIHV